PAKQPARRDGGPRQLGRCAGDASGASDVDAADLEGLEVEPGSDHEALRPGGRPRPPRPQADRFEVRARPPVPESSDPQFPPQRSTCARFVVPCRRPWAEMLSRMPMPTRVVASEVPP